MINALRYFDCGLVLVTAPFVAAAGLPMAGYAIAAGAWILVRLLGVWLDSLADRSDDPRTVTGLMFAAMMARLWIVVLAIVTAFEVGGRDDGIMAAVLSLAAFTVYFLLNSIVFRPQRRPVGS
jgi:threonine/homoserine efflux transporter RhtA